MAISSWHRKLVFGPQHSAVFTLNPNHDHEKSNIPTYITLFASGLLAIHFQAVGWLWQKLSFP
jgi:hypothetical protein